MGHDKGSNNPLTKVSKVTQKKVSRTSSNGPPRNYRGALEVDLKTCAKRAKLRVYNEFQKQVVDAWRDINEEFLRPTVVPMPLLMCVLNLSRVMDVIYTGGDGYTHVGKVMKNNVASLLIHSIV
ncbi:Sesquiterpene synthase [Vitis vinifera]|uniref:Sesquiterpene synthase n=1 Tax=Vitis vinifera TaxID=29760 RepID=A0A438HEM8_VITVI|nr:Sesquiterpene synthase [Vitis vinifera]